MAWWALRAALLGGGFVLASAWAPPLAAPVRGGAGGCSLHASSRGRPNWEPLRITMQDSDTPARAMLQPAGGLFEPTFESRVLYQEAAQQMVELHAGKGVLAGQVRSDAAFWLDLEARLQRTPGKRETDLSDPESLWCFDHFLTKQKLIALPLTGRTRIDGVSRLSLGPLKELDEGRRQVRAVAYYPSLPHQPFHDFTKFSWLSELHANQKTMRAELDRYLSSPDNKWAGNNCQDFDQYGWTQVSLNTFGQSHDEALKHFPETMALLADVPYGPRDLCIVRQRARSGLPRHSDQRNYMLTAHIVLKSPTASDAPAAAQQPEAAATERTRGGAGAATEKRLQKKGFGGGSAGAKGVGKGGKAKQGFGGGAAGAQRVGKGGKAEKNVGRGGLDEQSAVAETQAAALDQQFKCSLWCDGREQEWREGAATVIDTTYWHQTWNSYDEDVYVLLIDFWHPDLSAREVEALKAFTELEGIYLEGQGIKNGLAFRDAI